MERCDRTRETHMQGKPRGTSRGRRKIGPLHQQGLCGNGQCTACSLMRCTSSPAHASQSPGSQAWSAVSGNDRQSATPVQARWCKKPRLMPERRLKKKRTLRWESLTQRMFGNFEILHVEQRFIFQKMLEHAEVVVHCRLRLACFGRL